MIGVLSLGACQGNSGAVTGASVGGTDTPSAAAPASTCPTPPPDLLAALVSGSITQADSGKRLVVHQTDRFSVYLDDSLYPLTELRTTPADRLGIISNGAIRGPNCYPVMFEAVSEGRAVVRDRGFQLEVVVDNKAPVSQIPLH